MASRKTGDGATAVTSLHRPHRPAWGRGSCRGGGLREKEAGRGGQGGLFSHFLPLLQARPAATFLPSQEPCVKAFDHRQSQVRGTRTATTAPPAPRPGSCVPTTCSPHNLAQPPSSPLQTHCVLGCVLYLHLLHSLHAPHSPSLGVLVVDPRRVFTPALFIRMCAYYLFTLRSMDALPPCGNSRQAPS